MNYQILIGKKVMIGESEFQVEKIEKFKDIDYTTKFKINDGPAFKHFDVAVAVGIVENEEKLANRPKGLLALLKRTFGLFVRTGAIDPVTVSASVRDSYFISMSGFRKFGFKKVGFYKNFVIFGRTFDIEFCWNHKEEYEKGDLPDPYLQYKKVF